MQRQHDDEEWDSRVESPALESSGMSVPPPSPPSPGSPLAESSGLNIPPPAPPTSASSQRAEQKVPSIQRKKALSVTAEPAPPAKKPAPALAAEDASPLPAELSWAATLRTEHDPPPPPRRPSANAAVLSAQDSRDQPPAATSGRALATGATLRTERDPPPPPRRPLSNRGLPTSTAGYDADESRARTPEESGAAGAAAPAVSPRSQVVVNKSLESLRRDRWVSRWGGLPHAEA
jgi:hypothetical protein